MRAIAALRNYLHDPEGVYRAAIVALFAVGIVLRVIHLFDVIRLDEATTYVRFASRPFAEALSSYELPNNHLLNTFLVKCSAITFGPEPWSLRLPNFFAGLGVMALVTAIARRWFGRAGAVAALAAAAVALPSIHYGVLARGYTLMTFLCLLSLWSIERRHTGGGPRWTLLAALSSALAVYAVATALLFVLPLAAYDFVLSWKEGKRALALRVVAWLGAGALAALLYLPIVLANGPDQLFANEYNARLGPGEMGQYIRLYGRALRDEKSWAAGGVPLWGPLVLLGAVAATLREKRAAILLGLCALTVAAFFAARFPLPTRVLSYVATLVALAIGALAAAAVNVIREAGRGRKKAAWVGAASVVALAVVVGAVGERKDLIDDSLRSGPASKARPVAAALAELPPVTRVVIYGWYHDTVKYYLMLNGSPTAAYDRNPPQAYTFEAYVLAPPYSTPQKEVDPFFWGGPLPVLNPEPVRVVEGYTIWKVVIVNPY